MGRAPSPTNGLVLSGGGVRGAYEVGVIAGILEALALHKSDRSPFHIYAGTSVGALNAAFLACESHRGDLGIERLIHLWTSLTLEEHLRVRPLGLLQSPAWLARLRGADSSPHSRIGRSLLDARPIESIIRTKLRWARLGPNIANGDVHGLIVAALEIATGRTSIFAQLSPQIVVRPSRDPRRRLRPGPIGAEHVLASSALPLLFPARRIGRGFYCDGGLRFNTPIAPVIRAGANKLVVVSALHQPPEENEAASEVDLAIPEAAYPSLPFLLGKLLNAVLLDPLVYDLQVLARLNRLWRVLEQTLTADEMVRVQKLLVETRGAPYRSLDTLVFYPSVDIGLLAGTYARQVLADRRLDRASHWFLSQATRSPLGHDADFASYLLLDGGFCRQLIELGRTDAHAKAEEIRQFLGPVSGTNTQPSDH